MKSNKVKSVVMWWLSIITLALLTSCGSGYSGMGSGYGGIGGGSGSSKFKSMLSSAQEVPPNTSAGSGSGSVMVNPVTKELMVTVTTSGIVGTAAHIHEGATGMSGPVIFPLAETPAGSGQWSASVTLTDKQLTSLNAGNYYFNVHSAAYPNGEIRGQILLPKAQRKSPQGGGGGY